MNEWMTFSQKVSVTGPLWRWCISRPSNIRIISLIPLTQTLLTFDIWDDWWEDPSVCSPTLNGEIGILIYPFCISSVVLFVKPTPMPKTPLFFPTQPTIFLSYLEEQFSQDWSIPLETSLSSDIKNPSMWLSLAANGSLHYDSMRFFILFKILVLIK